MKRSKTFKLALDWTPNINHIGFFVAQKHAKANTPMICLETALPIKFSETVFESVGIKPILPEAFSDIENKPQRIKKIQSNPEELKKFIYSKVKDL